MVKTYLPRMTRAFEQKADSQAEFNALGGHGAGARGIDRLFTDVGLPGPNGRQLAEKARRTTKPYTREQVAARIREILDLPRWKRSEGERRTVAGKSLRIVSAEDDELVRCKQILARPVTLEALESAVQPWSAARPET